MNEAYVSFETAKLLKEKGFDWECLARYDKPIFSNNVSVFTEANAIDWNTYYYGSYYKFSAPTQQMACRWLREVYKIFISIGVGTDIDGVFGYMPSIYFLSILSCDEGRFVPNVDADDICDSTPQTYEDAVEAALEYVLKNLI